MKVNNSFFYNKLYNNINPVPNKCPIRRRSFHLPNGILFTFHLQYTNLTNNPLGISFCQGPQAQSLNKPTEDIQPV